MKRFFTWIRPQLTFETLVYWIVTIFLALTAFRVIPPMDNFTLTLGYFVLLGLIIKR